MRAAVVAAAALVVGLGFPASAGAGDVDVHVTATIKDTFSLTVRTSGTYSFGEKKPGKRYASERVPLIAVKSSRPWVLSDTSANTPIDIGGKQFERSKVIRHETNPGMDRIIRAGSYEVTCRYWLDLTDKRMTTLPVGTPIAADLSYTIIQQD